MSRIYFDHNASSPMRPEALSALTDVSRTLHGNPSSAHQEGQVARGTVEAARERIAAALGAKPSEIIFTSGGTESCNLAILGITGATTRRRYNVITSAIEHAAVLNACKALPPDAEVRIASCDAQGRIASDDVARLIDSDTLLVSLQHANNEVGTIQQLRDVATRAHRKGVIMHTDAVQTVGRVPVRVDDLDVDLLSLSAHKLGGPQGVGALYMRAGTSLRPRTVGGDQERQRRAGTENVAGVAAFAAAVQAAVRDVSREAERLAALRNRVWETLRAALPDILLNGNLDRSLPNTLNVSFPRLSGDDVMRALDLDGLAVSTGSACAVGARKPSHVLQAMGLDNARQCGSIRISLGHDTTAEDADAGAALIATTVTRLYKSGRMCPCGVS